MKQLVAWRSRNGLSQTAAAKKFNISKRQYVRWEQGECVPSFRKMVEIRIGTNNEVGSDLSDFVNKSEEEDTP